MEIQQVNCPICICMFTSPVTLHCGHSFCRQCLTNAIKNKNYCPICRQDFQSMPNKLKIDQNISKIIEQVQQIRMNKQRMERQMKRKSKMTENNQKNNEEEGAKYHNMLLIDVKTTDLLIPYNKSIVKFELQHPSLLQKLELFIARQQPPFNNYGLVANLISKDQIRYNLYQCVIYVKGFCKIEQQWVQNGQQNGNQYYYRSCDAIQIPQEFNNQTQEQIKEQIKERNQQENIVKNQSTKLNNLQKLWKVHHLLMLLLKTIPNKNTIKSIDKIINKQILIDRSDPIAVYYSIIGIINIVPQAKYQTICTFNTSKRVQQLVQFFDRHIISEHNDKINFKNGSSGSIMLCLHKNARLEIQAQYIFLFGIFLVFILLYFWGQPEKGKQTGGL